MKHILIILFMAWASLLAGQTRQDSVTVTPMASVPSVAVDGESVFAMQSILNGKSKWTKFDVDALTAYLKAIIPLTEVEVDSFVANNGYVTSESDPIYAADSAQLKANINALFVDSTRLIQDSILVYYQGGSEVGRDTIAGTGTGGGGGIGTESDPIYAADSAQLKADIAALFVDSTRLIQDSILVYFQSGVEVGRDTIAGTGGGGGGGIGTESDPIYAADSAQIRADLDSARQVLSISNDTLSISNGNSVVLPSGGGASVVDESYLPVSISSTYENSLITQTTAGSDVQELYIGNNAADSSISVFLNTDRSFGGDFQLFTNGLSGGINWSRSSGLGIYTNGTERLNFDGTKVIFYSTPVINSQLTNTATTGNNIFSFITTNTNVAAYSGVEILEDDATTKAISFGYGNPSVSPINFRNKNILGIRNSEDFYMSADFSTAHFVMAATTGKIGINEATPSFQLDVNGTVGFTALSDGSSFDRIVTQNSLTGELGYSTTLPEAARNYSATTSSTGSITISHSLGVIPSVTITNASVTPYVFSISSVTTTNFTISVYDMSGSLVNSTSVNFDYQLIIP